MRGRNDGGDQEDRSLGLFDNARYRQPAAPIEKRHETKVVGDLLLVFDTEGNANNMNRKESHKALGEARGKWEKNSLDSYSFTFYEVNGDSAPEHPQPVTVTVQNGQAVSLIFAQTGESVPVDARGNIPSSIEAILDRIHKDIDTNIASFDVQYYDNGVPRKVCETKILPHGRTDMDCSYISNVSIV